MVELKITEDLRISLLNRVNLEHLQGMSPAPVKMESFFLPVKLLGEIRGDRRADTSMSRLSLVG
jgi:hypothetical protein